MVGGEHPNGKIEQFMVEYEPKYYNRVVYG